MSGWRPLAATVIAAVRPVRHFGRNMPTYSELMMISNISCIVKKETFKNSISHS